jgi:protein gp37
MGKTKIPYVDYNWNVFAGCSKISEGCKNCYAEKMTIRLNGMMAVIGNDDRWAEYSSVLKFDTSEIDTGVAIGWNEEIMVRSGVLEQPLYWKTPRRIFVNCLSDTFHERVPFEQIDKIMAVIALCPQHEFLIFTKRYERMYEYYEKEDSDGLCAEDRIETNLMSGGYPVMSWPPPNLTLVHSYCNQEDLDKGLPFLLKTPATKRIISFEPLISEVDFTKSLMSFNIQNAPPVIKPNAVIIGAESNGSHAGRECKSEWVENLVQQADSAGILVYIKQLHLNGKLVRDINKFPQSLQRREWPK